MIKNYNYINDNEINDNVVLIYYLLHVVYITRSVSIIIRWNICLVQQVWITANITNVINNKETMSLLTQCRPSIALYDDPPYSHSSSHHPPPPPLKKGTEKKDNKILVLTITNRMNRAIVLIGTTVYKRDVTIWSSVPIYI